MNLNNRRLKEIQREKQFFKELLNKANETDKLTFQGKIDLLENEEKEILEKQGVQI